MGRVDSETWKKYKSKTEWERDAIPWRMGQRVPNFRQDYEYQVEDLNGSYVSGTDSEDRSTRFIVSHQAALEAFLRTCGAGQWRFDITTAPKDGSMVLLAWEIRGGIDCGVDRWDSVAEDWTLRVVPFAWASVPLPRKSK